MSLVGGGSYHLVSTSYLLLLKEQQRFSLSHVAHCSMLN